MRDLGAHSSNSDVGQKERALRSRLASLGSVLVAYSRGTWFGLPRMGCARSPKRSNATGARWFAQPPAPRVQVVWHGCVVRTLLEDVRHSNVSSDAVIHPLRYLPLEDLIARHASYESCAVVGAGYCSRSRARVGLDRL